MRKFLVVAVVGLIAILFMLDTDFPFIKEDGDGSPQGFSQAESLLEARLLKLEAEIQQLKLQTGKLEYPVDVQSKAAIEQAVDEFLPNKILDIIWKKTFHYLTLFESLDGFGGSGVTIANDQLTFATGAVSGNFAEIFKQPNNQGLATFSQRSFLRTNVKLAQITNQTIYITVGNVRNVSEGYGFKISDDTLYGVSNDGTTESTVKLQVLQANQKYHIEARYLPGQRIVFFADDPTTTPVTSIREVGSKVNNLPIPDATGNTLFFFTRITTNAAAAKIMWMSFVEYLQFRNVLK